MDFPAQHVSLQRTAGGDARATGQAARHAITDRRWTIADSRAKATHAGFATTWLRAFSLEPGPRFAQPRLFMWSPLRGCGCSPLTE